MQFTLSTLIVLVLVLAAAAFWHEGMRVREVANRIAVDACRRRSLQFLDGTVALTRQRPRIGRGGLRVERTYVFDYTTQGVGRARGFIIMLGDELQHLGLQDGVT